MANVWHEYTKWHTVGFPCHAAFTVVPFYIFLLPKERLHIAKNIYIYIYIYIYARASDCVEIVFEIPLVANSSNTVSETFLHKRGAVRSVDWLFIHCGSRQTGGDWVNTWHWTESFITYFKQEASAASLTSKYCSLPHCSRRTLLLL
jgi:hypothetical protein